MTSTKAAYSLESAREFQQRIPFVVQLGIVTERLGEGEARLVLPIARALTNSFGNAHGGAIMTLLDVAMCTAARTLHPESTGVMTIDFSTSFIGTAGGARIVADARVLRNGRSLIFTECEARNDDGALVAKAIGTVRAWLKGARNGAE